MKDFIKLAEIFQDHMILQQKKPVKIRGNADSHQSVTVTWNGTKVWEGVCEGDFTIILPPMEASENGTLKLSNGTDSIVLGDIDVGEVWIAAGQSNMEFPLLYDRQGDDVIRNAYDEHLRYYEVGKYCFSGEREENIKIGSDKWFKWQKFVPEECDHFSAVAVYFAMRLRKELQIPVGIVSASWGGTTASAWMDEEILCEDPILKVYTDTYDLAVSDLNLEQYIQDDRKMREYMNSPEGSGMFEGMRKTENLEPLSGSMRELAQQMMSKGQGMGPHSENRPGGLYHVMLRQITGYTVKGVIWYQGESDEDHAQIYARLFTRLIECWRRDWQEELPFLFVQLAPLSEWMFSSGDNYPAVRQQQQIVEDTVSRVWMASIMDVGSRYDIHPKDKAPVGERLALLALDKIYGIPQKYCRAPRIRNIVRNGQNIILDFMYAEEGLTQNDDIAQLCDLTQNGVSLVCKAELNGSQVILTCPEIDKGPATFSMAYRPYLKMCLYNKGGLPARPFAPQEI